MKLDADLRRTSRALLLARHAGISHNSSCPRRRCRRATSTTSYTQSSTALRLAQCVHGWWTLLTLRRLFPDMPERRRSPRWPTTSSLATRSRRARLSKSPAVDGFERPYGWAAALPAFGSSTHDRPGRPSCSPLASAFADCLRHYLGILTYPIRVGTHFNTAFALILSLEWAKQFDAPLAGLIRNRATGWFDNDRDCQAWEPGGDEFLSPALIEALCMARVLPSIEFERWFAAFCRDSQRANGDLVRSSDG